MQKDLSSIDMYKQERERESTRFEHIYRRLKNGPIRKNDHQSYHLCIWTTSCTLHKNQRLAKRNIISSIRQGEWALNFWVFYPHLK